jgi:hypothetical protein
MFSFTIQFQHGSDAIVTIYGQDDRRTGALFQEKAETPLFISMSPSAHSSSSPLSTGDHFADGHSPPFTAKNKNVLRYASTHVHGEVLN